MRALVIAKQRSGSTLLVDMLGSHPDIVAYEEILEYATSYEERVASIEACEDNAIAKIMYNQLTYAIEEYIKEKQVPIIHLKREDHARRLVSEYLNMHKEYIGREEANSTQKPEPAAMMVDPAWVKLELDDDIKNMAHFSFLFRKNPYIEVNYSELVGGEGKEVTRMPMSTAKRLLDFLGLEYHTLTTKLRKQNPFDLKKSVLNYDELMEIFNDST